MLTKDELQSEVVDKFLKIRQGYFLATGGVGKSRTGIKCILALNNPITHIVVPSIVLKEQWEKQLLEWNITNTRVFVVNSYISTSMICDFLIIDEAHKMAGAEAVMFNKCIHESTCEYFLALSATLSKEHIDALHSKNITLIREVKPKEALANNWIVGVIEHNIYVTLTPTEKAKYDEAQKMYLFYFKTFFSSWDNMKKCLNKYTIDSYVAERNKGLDSSSPLYMPKSKLQHHAAQYMIWVKKRKDIIFHSHNKIAKTIELITLHPNEKIIIFSESIAFCDLLAAHIPEAKLYHSKLTAKVKKANLESFVKGECKIIIGGKSLDAGFDDPEVTVGIIVSGTSSNIQARQRNFRLNRYKKDKISNLYNLITQDTQEENWKNKRQKLSEVIEYDKQTEILDSGEVII